MGSGEEDIYIYIAVTWWLIGNVSFISQKVLLISSPFLHW